MKVIAGAYIAFLVVFFVVMALWHWVLRKRGYEGVEVTWIWYDLWVGAYWNSSERKLYVCPLPTLAFKLNFNRKTTP